MRAASFFGGNPTTEKARAGESLSGAGPLILSDTRCLRRAARRLLGEGGDAADDAILLLRRDLRKHRQGQHAAARLLANREITRAIAEVPQAILLVQRE